MAAPLVSVIVATRNRAESLRRLIPALLALSPRLDWELVVADNGSSDDTASVLASFADVRLRPVHEARPGKCRALNRGVAAARGELLVFTDDDIEPDRGWLDELVAAAARHPEVECFGGRIDIDASSVPQWVLRSRLRNLLTSSHDFGDAETRYPVNRMPIGPNMAVRRRLLAGRPDPFPVELGPGTAIPVGDETAFFYRLGIGPAQTVYVPAARVRHRPEPGYFSLRNALRRAHLGGYGAGFINARYPAQAAPELASRSALRKVAQTRSLREFACSAVRVLGYVRGYLKGRAGASP